MSEISDAWDEGYRQGVWDFGLKQQPAENPYTLPVARIPLNHPRPGLRTLRNPWQEPSTGMPPEGCERCKEEQ